jgi:hypothetical protein
MGETDVIQTNTLDKFAMAPEPPKVMPKWKKWAIIGGAVAVVATVAIVLATRGGKSASSANPTITISPGPVTVGGN